VQLRTKKYYTTFNLKGLIFEICIIVMWVYTFLSSVSFNDDKPRC